MMLQKISFYSVDGIQTKLNLDKQNISVVPNISTLISDSQILEINFWIINKMGPGDNFIFSSIFDSCQ